MTSTSPVIYDASIDSMATTVREGRVAHTAIPTSSPRPFACCTATAGGRRWGRVGGYPRAAAA